jgi:flagellar motor switch protein FliG
MSGAATSGSVTLKAAQKAAVLILALGEEKANTIFSKLNEDELKDLSFALANLGMIPAHVVEDVCREFADSIGATGALIGNLDTAQKILSSVLPPDRVAQILEEIRGPAGRTLWDKLGNVSENVLANFLKNEYPQTVAVVLSKIKRDHAAKVLALLPESFAIEVVMRMLRMESPQKLALEGVERTLKQEFMSNLSSTMRQDPHQMLATMFNKLSRQAEGRLLMALEERDRDAAERIRSLMFTFEDLKRLEPDAIRAVIRVAPKERLVIALKGASPAIHEIFFKNMSERAGRMLKDDLANLGPVRLRDVEAAQMELVTAVKDMAERGEIRLVEPGDDDVMI